jgi:hypothetical protein
VVKGKFGGGKQFWPTVRRESDVGRRENRDKVVLSCLNGTLSFVGPMNVRGNVLEGERWLLAPKRVVRSEDVSLSKTMKVMG